MDYATNDFGVVTPDASWLLGLKPRTSVEDFLTRYSKHQDINIPQSRMIIAEAIRHHHSTKTRPVPHPECLRNVEQRWYDNLYNDDGPDYGIYDDDHYFAALWACWVIYSRSYLRSLMKPNMLEDGSSIHRLFKGSKTVADLGCGIGYTTATLGQLFPESNVYGTNLESTRQYGFCKEMSQRFEFTVVPDIASIGEPVDFVFASEYFEHISDATDHLSDVLTTLTPQFLYVANSFNTRSAGHFEFYSATGRQPLPAKEMTPYFKSIMNEHGYTRLKTRLWNNKPSVWVRKES